MPVTATLSKKFYEKLSDDVANELVNWFNAVDATYRADLRQLNELNFSRFDAKLEQRLTELRATLRTEFDQDLGGLKADLLKWMFTLWASVVLALVLLAFRVG